VFLARRGYHVQVFERRPDMRTAGYKGGRKHQPGDERERVESR
jgi:hypothetical protein